MGARRCGSELFGWDVDQTLAMLGTDARPRKYKRYLPIYLSPMSRDCISGSLAGLRGISLTSSGKQMLKGLTYNNS